MTDSIGASGTVPRTPKPTDAPHPHYFSSYQNYCCGPKANAASNTSTKDFLPIPEKLKAKSESIVAAVNEQLVEKILSLTRCTSALPREFFEQGYLPDAQKYLVDRIMVKMLNEARVINWMPSLKRLYPVRTSGNGNCLLHAVLIAMAGVHDFNLYLRDRLLQFMDKNKDLLKSSWKAERLKTDQIYGIQSEESKLDSEWEELCDLVRYENTDDGQATSNLQFLEGVHIFSVSNMLARPIIILSEDVVRNKHGEAISYNDLFGIYLPVLARPEHRVTTPIVLAYDQSHFCPLQVDDADTGSSSDCYLPLYQSIDHVESRKLLPIRFLGNEGSPEHTDKLLRDFLRLKTLSHYPDTKSGAVPVVCAELGKEPFRHQDSFFLIYYDYLADFYETQKRKAQQREEQERRRQYDDYQTNGSAYETTYRPLAKSVDSSSPPPPYSSVVTTRLSDHKNNPSYERRSSYDKALTNAPLYTANDDDNRSIQQRAMPHQPSQSPVRYALASDPNKQYTAQRSNWDASQMDPIPTTRTVQTLGNSPRGGDSLVKQAPSRQTGSVQIPINFSNPHSPTNLIDLDSRNDHLPTCLVCHRVYQGSSLSPLCSDCTYNKRHLPHLSRTNVTAGPMATSRFTTFPQTSDFFSPMPPLRSTVLSEIKCPRCRVHNTVDSTQFGLYHACSNCGVALHRYS